eukprot:TRINITY_DN18457_c0_g1_i1.p1 TRINITY_DN18457_c0_g1~~TRINITY_DN18457_c0_g1_i1.p1  ORF type:complete len:457 (-),score=80.54 TRINITY_DN18457_c0_g1_i1:67-1377(-)
MAAALSGCNPYEAYVMHLRSAVVELRSRLACRQKCVSSDGKFPRKGSPPLVESMPLRRMRSQGRSSRSVAPGTAPRSLAGNEGKVSDLLCGSDAAPRKRSLSSGRSDSTKMVNELGFRSESRADLKTSSLFMKPKARALLAALERKVAWVQDEAYDSMNGETWAASVKAAKNGRLSLNIGEVLEKAVAAGMSPDTAMMDLRDRWMTGVFRFYGDSKPEQLGPAGTGLKGVDCRLSPVCSRLCWGLLRGVLLAFRESCLRPSLQLLLETCRGAFKLNCDVLDIVVALALAPCEACDIEMAPWPIAENLDGGTEEMSPTLQAKLLLESAIILLHEDEQAADDESIEFAKTSAHIGFVFPPFRLGHASATEEACFGHEAGEVLARAEACLRDAQLASNAAGERLNIAALFSVVRSLQPSSCNHLTVAAVLWVWEKNSFN